MNNSSIVKFYDLRDENRKEMCNYLKSLSQSTLMAIIKALIKDNNNLIKERRELVKKIDKLKPKERINLNSIKG